MGWWVGQAEEPRLPSPPLPYRKAMARPPHSCASCRATVIPHVLQGTLGLLAVPVISLAVFFLRRLPRRRASSLFAKSPYDLSESERGNFSMYEQEYRNRWAQWIDPDNPVRKPSHNMQEYKLKEAGAGRAQGSACTRGLAQGCASCSSDRKFLGELG